ncbi:hypothetical protein PHYSODRAFT_501909, partial [Phytophthora sojae]
MTEAQPPARKRPKRVVPFLKAHEVLYGVRVVERDPQNSAVKSVLCMFCAAFGREDDPLATARQRARTQKPKYWGGPCFRTDNYKSHLTMMHPVRWKEYQDLTPEAKQSYFGVVRALPKREQPRRSLDNAVSTQKALVFLLDRDVVDVALGEVLFRVEDVDDGGSPLFETTLDRVDMQDQQRSDGTAEYRAVVRSVELFQKVVTLLSAGLSFDQAAAVCQPQLSQQISRISDDGNRVARMARVVVGTNLQALSRVMQRSWAFSLSLHTIDRRRPGETEPHLFIDVRLRAYCSGKIKVFHLLTLPVTTQGDPSTTGEILFDTTNKFILALHKRWLWKVIGCSTELAGATGSAADLAAVAGFVRVSSGRPSLDVLLQRFFDSVLFADGAEWHGHFTNLLAYLQRQVSAGNAEELSAASVTSCPRIADMSWWKLIEVLRWLDNARVPIQRLLSRRNATVTPPAVWWLNLKIMLEVGSIAVKTRAGLQGGYTTLMSQQPQRISMLRLALSEDVGVEGPLPEFQRAALRDHSGVGDKIASDDGMFAV